MDCPDFIIRKAEELDGELIIVTTGRLTNLAEALQKDPALPKKKSSRVVTMGGCMKLRQRDPGGEANIYGDARAADIVFRRAFT